MSSPKQFKLHYRKHKHTPEKVEAALLFDIQNYIPLYSRFFDLNDANYNQLQLNQRYYIQNINESVSQYTPASSVGGGGGSGSGGKDANATSTPNLLETTIVDDEGNSKNVPIFVKYSPLLDPIRYLSGKYDVLDQRTTALPQLTSTENMCNAKMIDKNNASYIDGFFSYLTSKTLHNHGNVHGVDYYGSYLCKQREFSTNIYDDVEYLIDCAFFNSNEEKLFTLEYPFDDESEENKSSNGNGNGNGNVGELDANGEKVIYAHQAMNMRTKLRKIIGTAPLNFNLDEQVLKGEIVDTIETIDIESSNPTSTGGIVEISDSLEEILLDDDVASFNKESDLNIKVRKSSYRNNDGCESEADSGDSSDSESSLSHSSNTTASSDQCDEENVIDLDNNNNDANTATSTVKHTGDERGSESSGESESDGSDSNASGDDSGSESESGDDSGDDSGSESDSGSDSDGSYDSDDEKVIAKIKNFPVQAILLEKCVSTLDNIMMNDELTSEEWVSILFQVIMTLLIYQHMFEFTHNDLHTNNVMFIETTEEFIYYLYNDQYYKVPTYGRIFKIIDFGRAIYKFRGELMCSDSFNFKGDAATQYNFGPYFNPNKPVVEPNYSFDLCRFACALFDYFIHDIRKIEKVCKSDPIVNLIVKWTIDDKGRNVLYKSSGEERYPDFKLYKMIARSVHNHIPSTQINDPLFDQYKITYKKYKKHANIAAKFPKDGKNTHIFINVDELPCYSNSDATIANA
jgi:hypothetical protein